MLYKCSPCVTRGVDLKFIPTIKNLKGFCLQCNVTSFTFKKEEPASVWNSVSKEKLSNNLEKNDYQSCILNIATIYFGMCHMK